MHQYGSLILISRILAAAKQIPADRSCMHAAHLMVVDPPRRGDNFRIPGSAAAHARASRLLQGQRGDGLVGLGVLHNSGRSAAQVCVDIHVTLHTGATRLILELVEKNAP